MPDGHHDDGRAAPLCVFVHLQKTAGTALLKRIRHAVGADAVYPTPSEQGSPEVVLDVGRMVPRAADPGTLVVTGHFPLCVVDLIDRPTRAFTVLRDPVERVLSFLRHQREVDPRFAGASLEAVYDAPVTRSGLVHDHMVKMLSLTADEMTDGALTPIVVDEDRVAVALANLEHRVEVAGLQEHFEHFCDDLEAAFGWDLGAPLFMNRTSPVDVPRSLRDRIAEDNAYDLTLYSTFRHRWLQAHPTVDRTASESVG